jgi:MFS family permease
LTDFAAFVVVFTVSRKLAENGAPPWYLGSVGAGLSLCAGLGSFLGGWLAHRFDGRVVFLSGAAACILSILACGLVDPVRLAFLPGYWLMGLALGFLYPPLIGWLNQGEDAHANRIGVSRTLIVYCVAWNVGMMCGQLTAGSMFSRGAGLSYGVALAAAIMNLVLAVIAIRRVVPLESRAPETAAFTDDAREIAAAFKRLSWIANLGSTFGASLVIHLLPDLAVSIGIAPENHGQLLAGWRAVVIVTYLLMHLAAFWHYRLSASLASQMLAACGMVVIAQADSAGMLFVGLALSGQLVGYNYFSGLFYSTAGSSHEGRAFAAGIHEATLAAGMAAGTIVGGLLGTWISHRVPYLAGAGVMVILMGLQVAAWRVWVRPLRRHSMLASGEAVPCLSKDRVSQQRR